MTNEKSSRQASVAHSYCQAIAKVHYNILRSGNALDRELQTYFRENKSCGSRDRRFISQGLFGLWRWYGWLNPLLPKEEPANAFEEKGFVKALLIALFLEGVTESEVVDFYAESLGFDKLPDVPKGLQAIKKVLESSFEFKDLDIMALVPAWFAAELPEDIDQLKLIESLQTRPPLWLRLQGRKSSEALQEFRESGIKFKKHQQLRKSLSLEGQRLNISQLKSYKAGCFEVQDLASQALGLACAPKVTDTWWDVCAGGGGKTMLLADTMLGRGHIVASDIRAWKLDEVKRRAKRGKFKNISTRALKEDEPAPFREKFDGVLVDAPCSCTGTWRRNPDERWRSAASICGDFAKLQKEIIANAAEAVKFGGVFVYATCSISKRENEEVVEYILKNFPELALEVFPHPITGEAVNGMMRIMPYENNSDAMFAARFRKG